MTDTSGSDNTPVVLVTGGRRGIGRATAERFMAEGWRVALNDIDAADLAQTVAELSDGGTRASAHVADVSEPEEAAALIAEVTAAHGRLDVLVNNAATIRFAPILEYTAEDLAASLDTNFSGVFYCTQAAARYWVSNGVSGSVVMVSSVSAHQARPGHVGYGASKAAMEIMAKVAALELAPNRIRVNCVAPGGPVLTEFVAPIAAQPGFEEKVEASVPLGRTGRPEEVAEAIFFLATETASY
ncbi:MAG: SDR family NAD(P)-dependent oxidoreductase, partial [Acidimicrobiia bacterium]